jgi:hypothetical protein
MMLENTQDKIEKVFSSMAALVKEKNRRYGDSALSPKHIFSKLPDGEGIKIRLDDKISRIINADDVRKNDVADMMGYLCLLCISQNWFDFEELLD